jgi:hypothetical protein
MVDIVCPGDGNWLGAVLANAWALSGDILRDMGALFRRFEFAYTDVSIGAFGSVHLFMATKRQKQITKLGKISSKVYLKET